MRVDVIVSRLAALVLCAAFVGSVVALLLLISVELNLLDPGTYKRALESQRFRERLADAYAEQLASELAEAGAGDRVIAGGASPEDDLLALAASPPLRHLSQRDWEAILNDLAPPEWVQRQIEWAVDSAFAIVNSESRATVVRVSLAEPRARLAGEAGQRTVVRVVSSWPPCSDVQLAALASNPPRSLDQMPICRPPAQFEALLVSTLEAEVRRIAEQMPNEIVIGQMAPDGSERAAGDDGGLVAVLRSLQRSRHHLSQLTNWGWLVPVVLLLMIAGLAARSWRDLALWWGFPTLVAGASVLAVAFSLSEIVRLALAGASRDGPAPTSLLEELALGIATQLVGILANWLAWAGAAVAGVGLLMVIVASFLPGSALQGSTYEGLRQADQHQFKS